MGDDTRLDEVRAGAAPGESPSWLGDYPAEQSSLLARAFTAGGARAPDHALEVAETLHDLGMDAAGIAAAVLLERGAAAAPAGEELGVTFGAEVARLVDGVAKMDLMHEYRLAGADSRRQPKQIERLKKLLLTMAEDVRVVIIKLAQWLVRMRRLRELDGARATQAARLALDVYAPLASRLGIRHFKWELEDLALRALEPATYADLARRLDARRSDRERYIARVVRRLRDALAEAGIEAEVSGRPKHIYSIRRKMQEKSLGFEQVFDLRAVRVLVKSVADCYSALGIVHTLWTHIPREFDDYITKPKPNRYQSLHTAVIGPSGKVVEVQIRTHRMHAHAEYGVAAHWRYKEGDAGPAEDREARVAWLRQVLESREDGEGAGDLLDRLASELESDRVYVITPRGDILDLPAGATPLDFAYAVHTDIGHRCRGAKVDGTMVPLTHALESGAQVQILTTRTAAPSRDWLNPNLGYLKTARARAKVRHWFRQLDHDRNAADGQEIFSRELKRLGVSEPPRERLTARFNYKRFEDFLAGLGRGDVSAAQLAGALQDLLPPRPRAAPPPRETRRGRDAGDVRVKGVGSLLTVVARCCKPVPPEPIVGFITRGRGVSIHREDCANILRLPERERSRVIEVSWGDSGRDTYPVRVQITAYDRHGLLRDVTAVVANEQVNVAALSSRVDEREQTAHIELTVEVSGLAELARVMDRLAQLGNVVEVRRAP
ncbi:MAG: bifunctional (p)ppGpp synthetase/guanosine-3',5'-bis(diphosphate) 3'-pyrophosphohydrolase [Gammaproteobacteria bacterium]|nr:bifunctional (p)ppGpp synthetase/guanosine-3',5'-bis(diphosphate) 3'-pyrophosphohydrolase [Gammaproteobacteria bacterium]